MVCFSFSVRYSSQSCISQRALVALFQNDWRSFSLLSSLVKASADWWLLWSDPCVHCVWACTPRSPSWWYPGCSLGSRSGELHPMVRAHRARILPLCDPSSSSGATSPADPFSKRCWQAFSAVDVTRWMSEQLWWNYLSRLGQFVIPQLAALCEARSNQCGCSDSAIERAST